MSELGDRLAIARKKTRMTQTELADIIGVSRVTVGAYETGKVVPKPASLAIIAEALGTTVEFLNPDAGKKPVKVERKRTLHLPEITPEDSDEVAHQKAMFNYVVERLDKLFMNPYIDQKKKDKAMLDIMTAYINSKK